MRYWVLAVGLVCAPLGASEAQVTTFNLFGCGVYSCHSAVITLTQQPGNDPNFNRFDFRVQALSFGEAGRGWYRGISIPDFPRPMQLSRELNDGSALGCENYYGPRPAELCYFFDSELYNVPFFIPRTLTAYVAIGGTFNPAWAYEHERFIPDAHEQVTLYLAPEPSTYVLMGVGLLSIALFTRRRRSTSPSS